jgi:hypothetical protein
MLRADEDLEAHWRTNFPGISHLQGLDRIVRHFEERRIDMFEDRVMVIVFENFAKLAEVIRDAVRKPFAIRYYFEPLWVVDDRPEHEVLQTHGELTFIAVLCPDATGRLMHYFGGLACPNPNLN